MKLKGIFAALLLVVAGVQTAAAQGFRVYKSDGTVAQFSLRTDSIVFYDGIGSDVDFGPFTPVNQCIAGTWYKTRNETVTFNEDGTTDYMEGATYEFLPYQGTIIINNASGKPMNILKVHKVTSEMLVLSSLGSETFSVWSTEQPGQLVTSITLNPASLSIMPGSPKSIDATVLPADADNKEVEWTSSDENVAYVRVNQYDTSVWPRNNGTCTITCTAKDGSGVKATCQVEVGLKNGHEYVVIANRKWATMNVGATTVAGSYATCYGDYFAWGETEPRYSSILRTGESSAVFVWKNGSSGYTNYPVYSEAQLDYTHDAARVNWGYPWYTPTSEDFKALMEACTGSDSGEHTPVELVNTITDGGIYWLNSTQTIEPAYTGVAGILFVSKKDISKRVFFPAAGAIDGTSFGSSSSRGVYWSSDRDEPSNYPDNSNSIALYSTSVWLSWSYRCRGLTVRPVWYAE